MRCPTPVSDLNFQETLDLIPNPVFLKDASFRYITCNRAFERFTGLSCEALCGKTVFDIAPPDLARTYDEMDRHLWRDGGVQVYEWRVRDAEGRLRHVVFHKALLHDDQGRPSGIIGLILDITDRKRTEEALRRSEEHYRTLIDHSRDVIYAADRDLRFTFISPSVRRYGYAPEQVVGRPLLDFIHPDDRERMAKFIADAVREDFQKTVRFRILTADGAVVTLEESGEVLRDDDGSFRELVGILRDVTELEQEEEALRRAKAEAEARSEAKDQFIAAMSHELRNPLTPISGFVDLLLLKETDPEKVSMLRAIRQSADLLNRLISDILEFSRLGTESRKTSPEPCDLRELVEHTASPFRDQAEAKGLAFRLLWEAGTLPPLLVDKAKLQQVLSNLLSNAVKYTPSGSVTLRVAATPKTPSTLGVTFEVTDTGPGIPPEERERVFEKFYRSDYAKATAHGTGLGLCIAKALTEALGGTISLDSPPSGGAAFRVVLPLEAAPSTPAPAEPSPPPAAHILLVEDNETVLRMTATLLRQQGWQVTTATNGAEALRHLRETAFDLVFMDIQMPVLDGLEATRTLRREGLTLPVVALTAYSTDSDLKRLREAGFDGVLPKPFRAQQLYETVTRHLRKP